jgi:hypothetical protein
VSPLGPSRASGEPEDGVRGEWDADRLHHLGVGDAGSVPADRILRLDDEHGGALDVTGDLVHEVGEDLGEIRALLDVRDRFLELGVVGTAASGPPGLLQDLRDGHADLAVVDLLVVSGDVLTQLVEGTNQRRLVPLNGPLDLHHPVGHLLADEGGCARLQVVFEGHLHLGDTGKTRM